MDLPMGGSLVHICKSALLSLWPAPSNHNILGSKSNLIRPSLIFTSSLTPFLFFTVQKNPMKAPWNTDLKNTQICFCLLLGVKAKKLSWGENEKRVSEQWSLFLEPAGAEWKCQLCFFPWSDGYLKFKLLKNNCNIYIRMFQATNILFFLLTWEQCTLITWCYLCTMFPGNIIIKTIKGTKPCDCAQKSLMSLGVTYC